jgi:hypothetical protein
MGNHGARISRVVDLKAMLRTILLPMRIVDERFSK